MKHFILYMAIIFVTVFGGIALTNYLIDPGHVYRSQKYIDKVIEGISQGYHVEGITDIDERQYKLRFAKLHEGESFDYLALGSSRIMTVSKDILHGSTFLNLSISNSQIEELVAFYQISKDLNIHYKTLLITADPSFFNSHYLDDRWKSLGLYVNEFLGKETAKQEIDWDLIRNLLSVSYFRIALKSFIAGNDTLNYVKTAKNDGETFHTDGSFFWSRAVYEAPQSVVDEKARTCHYHLFKDFYDLSDERVALFTKLVESIKADGVKIYFMCNPYHPIFYKNILKLQGVVEAIDFIETYAKDNNIPVIGSFNPADVGLDGSDFYDGPHVRKECLDKIIEKGLFN